MYSGEEIKYIEKVTDWMNEEARNWEAPWRRIEELNELIILLGNKRYSKGFN